MISVRHQHRWVVSALLAGALLAMTAAGQGIALATPPGASQEYVQTYCTIAQWRGDRILGSYDITEQTYEGAREQARGVSFTVELRFPDVTTFRARIRSLVEQVCNAADPQAAGKALGDLEAGRKEILRQFQAWTGVSDGMKKAWTTLSARTAEQMKPFVTEAKARNKQASTAEWQRLAKIDSTAIKLANRVRELQGLIKSLEERLAAISRVREVS